ncbi:MAG TPA: thiamine pyrophosphate-requiring protein [Solirubrobacteraceae bacterium]|nr:thiamine pyrophosphate-requiring protein [Solirubrobacteraceae bacterium]
MKPTVADVMLERLELWGVRTIYGYPGDGINGFTSALRRAGDRFGFVQTRHEEAAALAACGHAKFGGGLGVCLVTSGPGAIHALNGLYDAKLDHQPVLALAGQQPRTLLGTDSHQEVDLGVLLEDVAHEYVQTAMHPAQVRHLVDRAARIALAERTVTCLIVPNDLQEVEVDGRRSSGPTSTDFTTPVVVPREADLRRAADILNAAKRPAIIVGQGALGATDEVTELADRLGAGAAKALLGKAALSDDEPWVTGAIGLLGTKPSWKLMRRCDALLIVGSSCPYPDFLPREGDARGIQIDVDPRKAGLRYPTEVNLIGDSAATLRALLPMIERRLERVWRDTVEAWVREWWKVTEARAMQPADPLNPQRVLWELSDNLPGDAIVTCDCGTATAWFARDVRLRPGMLASLSGNLMTMGTGVPYALAAKFAHPDRPVVALVGDGAMQMNGNSELITVAKYWREWADPRLVVLVLNNADLNFVTWEQRATHGDAKFAASQDLPDFPYARYAGLLDLKGIRVDAPDEVGPAWREALGADRPVVLEAVVDPDVPPLPPHITFEEAASLTTALLKGDPDARGVVAQSLRELTAGLAPQRR